MKKCIIIDDEPLAIAVLKNLISQVPDLELIGSFLDPFEARKFVEKNTVDLICLDIEMPMLNGLEFIKSLAQKPHIIITTAFRNFAAESFELDVLDYVMKPVSPERFFKAVGKFMQVPASPVTPNASAIGGDPFIFVRENKAMVKLFLKDIQYIEGQKNYVKIKLDDRDVITYLSISFMEEKLPSAHFIRVHKSYIINIRKINKITMDFVIITGSSIPIGNTYKEKIESILKNSSI
jgi:DNA-binding LytR/AlgR family response regulator